jgi:hypothetical protein
MKLINTTQYLPKKMAIKAIRSFTTNNPSETVVNEKNCYLACWTGNQEMWLEILCAHDYCGMCCSITVASTRQSIELTHRCYFYSNMFVTHFKEALAFYIANTGFTF